MLAPLRRREAGFASDERLGEALARIERLAGGESRLQSALSAVKLDRQQSGSWRDPDAVRRFVTLATVLYEAGRIGFEQYASFAGGSVVSLYEHRWLDGCYDEQLDPIASQMDAIRREHGLDSDQHWARGDGPPEHSRLEAQYDALLDSAMLGTLREFGLDDLARLKEQDAPHFDECMERGRRSTFHGDEFSAALRDIVVRFEEEAGRAAAAGAFAAAVASLGAGVEGLLVLRCLRSPKKAERIARKLPRKDRPQRVQDPRAWTFSQLIEVCRVAGWLASIDVPRFVVDSGGLVHRLRVLRNHIHPSKMAKDRPWVTIREQEFEDARAVYLLVLAAVDRASPT